MEKPWIYDFHPNGLGWFGCPLCGKPYPIPIEELNTICFEPEERLPAPKEGDTICLTDIGHFVCQIRAYGPIWHDMPWPD